MSRLSGDRDALSALKGNFQLLLDSIRDAVSIIDIKTLRIVAANRAFYRILGYSEKEVLNRHCYAVTHHLGRPCSGPDNPCPLANIFKKRTAVMFEHVHRRRNGETVYTEVTVSPIKDHRGRFRYAIHIAHDITERKRFEEELRNLKTAVEHSGEVIFLTDPEGVVTYVNPAFTTLYGFSADKVVGKLTPRILKSGKMKPENYRKFWRRISRRDIVQGEIINKTRDGRMLDIESAVSPILDSQGVIKGYLAIQRDITRRKQDEKRLNYMAYHDNVTDLPNRLLFNDRFQQAILRAARAKTMVAVMLMDLDRFKEVNDSLGHRVGDLLLKAVAGRLTAFIRRSDTVARLWGDEFGILAADLAKPAAAAPIARKLLRAFFTPFVVEGYELRVTASIGVSIYPADGDTIELLLKNADRAMYRAKEKGRNTFSCYRGNK